METVSEMTIIGQRIKLDGKHFKDCTLLDCELEYAGGEVILERTQITRCSHILSGPAFRTLNLLEVLGVMNAETSGWVPGTELVH